MAYLSEQAAYLRGLAEGMKIEESSNEGKLLLKIIEVLDRIRPYLENDGGNLEYIKFEDGIVYVRLLGACAGCSMIDINRFGGNHMTRLLQQHRNIFVKLSVDHIITSLVIILSV